MNTISEQVIDGRRRRRTHTPNSMPIYCGAGCRLQSYAPIMRSSRSHPAPHSRLRRHGRIRVLAHRGRRALRRLDARAVAVIRIDAMWFAAQPADMRAGADRLLARIVEVFGGVHAQRTVWSRELRSAGRRKA